MSRELELLAPAGSFETLKAVIHAGADAVYVGGSMFGARAYANNFNQDELLQAIDYGHIHNRKVYMAVNTLLKERELNECLYDYLAPYYEAGLDAIIVQDIGVFQLIKDNFTGLPIHTSTQMTVAGVDGAKFLKSMGAERIVTAREMSLQDIRAIHEQVDIELESFIHGALCYCYSGQCLLSSIIGGRSGNRGRCAQPCRLPYTVMNEKNKRISKPDTYMLSLKDMNTIEFLPEIAENGVYSFKVEGRMKSTEYAAGVVSVYREYMDCYLKNGSEGYQISKTDMQKLYDLGNRNGFTKGYYYYHNDSDMLTGNQSNHSKGNGLQQKLIAASHMNQQIKEKINGKLKLYKDSNAMMQITDGTYTVSATGDMVQVSEKRPLTLEVVLEKMRKTGNTPFEFDDFDIDMEEDVFLPVNQLNSLRRDCLEQLERKRLEVTRRTLDEKKSVKYPNNQNTQKSNGLFELTVSLENREYLELVVENAYVKNIYLDSTLYHHKNLIEELKNDVAIIKKNHKHVYYIMPSVFRKRTSDFYQKIVNACNQIDLDGYIVKSFDELGFLKENAKAGIELRVDHNLYTYSNLAKDFFYANGISRDTVPVELNKKELFHRSNSNSEMIIYGYLPLMVSSECVHKNTEGCDKIGRTNYLKDRYEMQFPVKNYCDECYNIIYNSKPLFLLHLAEDIERLQVASVRIHFGLETKEDVQKILQIYETTCIKKEHVKPEDCLQDYTNGHFKRGVE